MASQGRVEALLLSLQQNVARLPSELAVLLQATAATAATGSNSSSSSSSGFAAKLLAQTSPDDLDTVKPPSAVDPDDLSKDRCSAIARGSADAEKGGSRRGARGGSATWAPSSEGEGEEEGEEESTSRRAIRWASRFELPTELYAELLDDCQNTASASGAPAPLRPRVMPSCKEPTNSAWVVPTFNRYTSARVTTGQTSRALFPFHPSSRIRIVIDTSIFVLLAYDAVMVPYTLAWGSSSQGPLFNISLACTLFWIFELLSNFVTGYTEGDQLVMTVRSSIRHYLRTYFFLDLVVVSCDIIAIALEVGFGDGAQAQTTLMKLGRIAKAGRLFRIAAMLRTGRLARLGETLVEEAMQVAPAIFNGLTISLVKSTFLILWPSHVVCCAWYGFVSSSFSDTGLGWRMTLEDQGLDTWPSTYVYALGFYWSLASMLSGASSMPPLNSWECLFVSVHLIFGFIFCSSLISALAAKFIEHQMQNQERQGKLKTLRKFLHQHRVDGTLGIAIQHQVADRMRGEKRLAYDEVPVLSLLSASLRAELHYSIHAHYLRSHDILLACSEVDETLIAHLCAAAVTHVAFAPGEQVFEAGMNAGFMYIVSGGALEYDLMRNASVSSVFSSPSLKIDEVTVGRCICELALWLEWTTLGMLEATAPSELLRVAVGAFMSVLATPRHQAVAQVVADFAAKLCQAIDEEQPAVMTDLRVDVERDAVVASMSVASRALISRPMLGRLERTHGSRTAAWKRLEDLELEVTGGKCHLRLEPTCGRVVRIVQVVCLQLRRPDGAMFVEVAQQRNGTTRATLKLPGSKMRDGETLDDTLQRIQHQALPNAGGVHRALQEDHIEQGMSEAYGIETKYIRRVCSAMLEAGEPPDPEGFWSEVGWLPFKWDGVEFHQRDFCTRRGHNQQSGSDLTLYAWLSNLEYSRLESGGQELKEAICQWISGMDLQKAVVLPHDAPDNSISLSSSEAESEGNDGRVDQNDSMSSWLVKHSDYRRSCDNQSRLSGRRRSVRKSNEGATYMVIWHSRSGFNIEEAQTLIGARRVFSGLYRYQTRAIFAPDGTVVSSWYFSDIWRQKVFAHRAMLVTAAEGMGGMEPTSSGRHGTRRSSSAGFERRGNPYPAVPALVTAAATAASATAATSPQTEETSDCISV